MTRSLHLKRNRAAAVLHDSSARSSDSSEEWGIRRAFDPTPTYLSVKIARMGPCQGSTCASLVASSLQMTENKGITFWLRRWSEGDESALASLTPLVYDELHRLAESFMAREGSQTTLQPTALLHEAYLRLNRQPIAGINDRRHFFAIAARMMRQVLVDFSRRRRAGKRGGDLLHVTLDPALGRVQADSTFMLELDQALDRLAVHDERKVRAVEMRYFAGLDLAEIGEVLAISPATVKRDLAFAQAWLRRELSSATPS
jgi:RNA polymerase sigma-70 factor, ECF subfamily